MAHTRRPLSPKSFSPATPNSYTYLIQPPSDHTHRSFHWDSWCDATPRPSQLSPSSTLAPLETIGTPQDSHGNDYLYLPGGGSWNNSINYQAAAASPSLPATFSASSYTAWEDQDMKVIVQRQEQCLQETSTSLENGRDPENLSKSLPRLNILSRRRPVSGLELSPARKRKEHPCPACGKVFARCSSDSTPQYSLASSTLPVRSFRPHTSQTFGASCSYG